MNVLITGAASRLGRAIAAELGAGHRLRLLDSTPVPPDKKADFIQADLVDPEAVWQAVRGMDAVIHTGEPPLELPTDELECEQYLLDYATRGTHVLFSAAIEAGIRRFIYGSTLEIFRAYPDDIYISEMWKPCPTPEMASMSRYLGELTCREFARDYMVSVTVLRLGKLVLEEEWDMPPSTVSRTTGAHKKEGDCSISNIECSMSNVQGAIHRLDIEH